MDLALSTYVHQLPKLDLHHHFDGAFDLNHLYEEAKRRQLPQAKFSFEEFAAKCQVSSTCTTLTEFLNVFHFFYDIAQDRDFLHDEAVLLAKRASKEGLIYLETRFGPHLFASPTVSAEDATKAVIDGLKTDKTTPIRLILCVMRNSPPKYVEELIALYEKYHNDGVCGIDLAGDESLFACEEYAPLFDRAKALKIPVTIHAGEAAGPESVLQALDTFHARRIGHGIRSLESPSLVERLVKERTPLEICLTSNLQTGNAASYKAHPFTALRKAGVLVTINTDDPSVSGIDINHEWIAAIREFELQSADQKALLLNSVEAAFCDDALKGKLRTQIEEFFKN